MSEYHTQELTITLNGRAWEAVAFPESMQLQTALTGNLKIAADAFVPADDEAYICVISSADGQARGGSTEVAALRAASNPLYPAADARTDGAERIPASPKNIRPWAKKNVRLIEGV